MNNEIKEILENIKCPQLGYDEYGKWGALPLNVRMTLKRLCDYVVNCDDYITNLQQINNNQAKRNSRQRLANQKQQDLILNLQQENERLKLKYKSQKDINQKLLSIDIKHKKINGELREENSKLEIALQNIQEDYNKRIKEIDVLKKKLDRRYYKNEYERLKQENERLKELNKNASKVCMAEHRYGVDKAEEARDYKSRCEKAIEYIKEHSTSTYFSMLQADYDMNLDILLNILQNGGENDGD